LGAPRDDIATIIEFLPKTPERQTLLFLTTVSCSVQQAVRAALDVRHELADCVPKDESPVHAHVAQDHTVVFPRADHQIPHLFRLLAHDPLRVKISALEFLPAGAGPDAPDANVLGTARARADTNPDFARDLARPVPRRQKQQPGWPRPQGVQGPRAGPPFVTLSRGWREQSPRSGRPAQRPAVVDAPPAPLGV
jgi:hypothetical protein